LISVRPSALFGLLFMSTSVLAQGLGSIPSILKPEYFSRDLLLFIEGLNLTDEQAAISEMIFEDYDRDFQLGLDAMQLEVEDVAHNVGELGDNKDAIVQAVLAPIQGWAGKRDILGRQLVENIRIILDAEQQAAWGSFNRRLEREKALPEGKLSGESTNLQHVLRDMSIEPVENSPLSVAMLEWELAIADALHTRADATNQGLNLFEQININASGNDDIRRRQKELKARIVLRDTTDVAIERIYPLLGSDGAAFQREALKRGYGRVYRKTPAERIFSAALNNTTVKENASLLTAVQDLLASYHEELRVINTALLDMTREWEPELENSKIENRIRRSKGETLIRPQDPTRTVYQERRELGSRYVQLLRDLLGDDLFAELDGATRFLPRPKPTDVGDQNNGGSSIRPTGRTAGTPDYVGKKRSGGISKPSGLTGGPRGND
jgi:hypothetical protein